MGKQAIHVHTNPFWDFDIGRFISLYSTVASYFKYFIVLRFALVPLPRGNRWKAAFLNPGSTVSAKLKYDRSDLHIFWLVVNGAKPNAQQTIYRLYFGAFGTQSGNVRGGLFDSEGGGGCQILFGQIIYFWYGLGREIHFHVAWARGNLFSRKHGKP